MTQIPNIKSDEEVACFGGNCEGESESVKQLKKEIRQAEFIANFKERNKIENGN